MNCLQCSAPLENQARFCRNCGTPVAIGSSPMLSANESPTVPTPAGMPVPQPQWQPSPTQPAPQWNQLQSAQSVSSQPQYAPQPQWMPSPQQMPSQYAPPAAIQPGSMRSNGTSPGVPARRKRKWPLRLLITLLVLIVLLTAGWFFIGRPALHSVAQNQFDQLIASQVNTILPLPNAITSLAVTENEMNNLITLNHAPSDPVQNTVAHISPPVLASDGSFTGGLELDFQLYGFPCAIKAIPTASNGQIIMTHVQVTGILGLVMSPDEMTTLLNGHIHDALARLQRQVRSLTFKNQEVDIQLV